MSACFLAVISGVATADPRSSGQVVPDPVPRRTDPRSDPTSPVAPPPFRASSDLDGIYLWLGPVGAASRIDGVWDSTIGGELAVIRVRERAPLGAIGASAGAIRWTERGGGRIWIDAIAGTRLGRMVGASAGPLVELAELAHPRLGGSIGVWAFVGVTPFARVGYVDELGGFAEIGLHIALPVLRK